MLNVPYNFDLTETKLYCLTTFNYLILMLLIYIIDTCLYPLNVKFHYILTWLSDYYDQMSHIEKISFVLTAGTMNISALDDNCQNTYKQLSDCS